MAEDADSKAYMAYIRKNKHFKEGGVMDDGGFYMQSDGSKLKRRGQCRLLRPRGVLLQCEWI